MESFVINNNLIVIPHSKEPQIDLKIEVYTIAYDWGLAPLGAMANSTLQEYIAPYYFGTLDRQFTSANFSIDSTSDMRYTGSFSVILDYDSPFIVHANDRLFWQNVWFKVIKTYDYPNGNEETNNNRDEHIIGWFVPNSGNYDYNAASRELSMSCTDMMSFLTDNRGGHLSHWEESLSGLKYTFYEVFKAGTNFSPQVGTYTENFIKDNMYKVSRCASGLILEGDKNISTEEKQYDNFLTKYNVNKSNNSESIEKNALWKEIYDEYKSEHNSNGKNEEENEPWRIKFYYINENGEWSDKYYDDANSQLQALVTEYAHIMPIHSMLVGLQNGTKLLPYDLEFNGDTTLYDILKKVSELYPRQSVYFDSDRRLNVVQYALNWGGSYGEIAAKRKDLSGLTLEEHWDINLDGIKNFTVVWGRNQSCIGYYGITSMKGVCTNCGKFYEFYIAPTGANGESHTCPLCGGVLQRLSMNDETYSTQRIGTHKQVIYNDNLLTDEECFNEAKALTIASCRAKKTLSVTLFDRYLPLYNQSNGLMWGSDTGVGRLIEYTSTLTGETDLYTLLKWSNDFNSGTITLELEPFYPCIDERTYNILPIPKFTFEVDNTGLMTMNISGVGELFKIYCSKSSLLPNSESNIWYWTTLNLEFIGETDTSTFTYQFTESGTYSISCQAWSSTILPSGVADYKVFTVEINENIRLDINTGGVTTEINGSSVGIGVKHLVTKNGEYITDNEGNRFIY